MPPCHQKTLELVNTDTVDPEDWSKPAIKRFHAAKWLHKTYESFSILVHGKLKKISVAHAIKGARRLRNKLSKGKIGNESSLISLINSPFSSNYQQKKKTIQTTMDCFKTTSALILKIPALTWMS